MPLNIKMDLIQMHYLSIKINDSIGLNEREQSLIQTSVMNFAAMTSALIVGEDMVINPPESEGIGLIIIYSKILDEEIANEMKNSLENRLRNFFRMSDVDLRARI